MVGAEEEREEGCLLNIRCRSGVVGGELIIDEYEEGRTIDPLKGEEGADSNLSNKMMKGYDR